MADPIFAPYYRDTMQLTLHGLYLMRQKYPGLKFNHAHISIETPIPQDDFLRDGVRTNMSVSGSASDLIRHGFLSSSCIATSRCGVRYYRNTEQRGRFAVHKNKRGLRVNGSILDGIQLLYDGLEVQWHEFDRWRSALIAGARREPQDALWPEMKSLFESLPNDDARNAIVRRAEILAKRAHLRLVVNNTR